MQEDLNIDDNNLAEEDLTSEQWKELNKRAGESSVSKAYLMSVETFKNKLNENINALRGNNR